MVSLLERIERLAGQECSRASTYPEISVVLPVYRNRGTASELYDRLCKTLGSKSFTFELLFVDDACPDDSLSVLTDLAQRDTRVGVIAMQRNVGQHRAVLTGVAAARGEWIVVMDADLQDQPEIIPLLLEKRPEGAAAIFAGRTGRYEGRGRLITSRIFKRLLNVLSGVPVNAGLFVALNREMRDRLLAMAGERPYIGAMIGCAGLPVLSVPVVRDRRPAGTSSYSRWARLKSGGRAVTWVLRWRLNGKRGQPWKEPAAKLRLGQRFSHE